MTDKIVNLAEYDRNEAWKEFLASVRSFRSMWLRLKDLNTLARKDARMLVRMYGLHASMTELLDAEDTTPEIVKLRKDAAEVKESLEEYLVEAVQAYIRPRD